jgi:hypothetical protein
MRFPARNTILVIRFSSMGDVAMTVPVLRNLLLQHSSLHVIMLSQQHVSPLFNGIDRLRFIGADFKGEHKGLLGLWRLFMSVYKETGSIPVADLHGVCEVQFCLSFLRCMDPRFDPLIRVENKSEL